MATYGSMGKMSFKDLRHKTRSSSLVAICKHAFVRNTSGVVLTIKCEIQL